MYFICARHTNTIYVSKFQVNTVTNIEVIRQNVFSHERVMVIGVSSDLNHFDLIILTVIKVWNHSILTFQMNLQHRRNRHN